MSKRPGTGIPSHLMEKVIEKDLVDIQKQTYFLDNLN